MRRERPKTASNSDQPWILHNNKISEVKTKTTESIDHWTFDRGLSTQVVDPQSTGRHRASETFTDKLINVKMKLHFKYRQEQFY